MKNIKYIVVGGIFVAILFISGSVLALSSQNIVACGDFENDCGEWRNYGLEQTREIVEVDGRTVMHLSGQNGVGIQQIWSDLEPGSEYLVSYDIRVVQGRFSARVGAENSNRDFENKQTILYAYNVWQTQYRIITIPDSRDVRLVFSARNVGGGVEFYLDNVSLIPYQSENIIIDGNMEAETVGLWGDYGVAQTKEKISENGNNILHIAGQVSVGIQQSFDLLPGATYELNYRAKVSSGKMNVRIGDNNSNRDFENASKNIYSWNRWEDNTRTFVVPESGKVRFVFSLKNHGGFVESFLDDISVNFISAPAEEPIYDHLNYIDGFDYMVFGDSLSDGYLLNDYPNPEYQSSQFAYPNLLLSFVEDILDDEAEYYVGGGAGATMNAQHTPWRDLINYVNYNAQDEDMIIVWGGINDVLEWAHYGGTNVTGYHDFRDGYLELITAIKQRNTAVGRNLPILVGTLHDITRLPVAQIDGWNQEKINMIQATIAGYNQAIREIAEQEDLILVDFSVNDSPMYAHERGGDVYQADGIHPNEYGQELIRDYWWNTISELF